MIQLRESGNFTRRHALPIGKESIWPLTQEASHRCEVVGSGGGVVESPVFPGLSAALFGVCIYALMIVGEEGNLLTCC